MSTLVKAPRLEQIFIEPTVRCNLRCPLCFRGRGDVPALPDMTLTTFKNLLAQVPYTCEKLALYNFGETLLHPDACEMIRLAAKRGLRVQVASNFNVLPDMIPHILQSGLHELVVPIDGVKQPSYEAYRIGGNLERVLSNVGRFLVERTRLGNDSPRLILQFLIMQHNEHEISDFFTLAWELGVDEARVKSVTLRSYREEGHILPARDLFRRYGFDGVPVHTCAGCRWPMNGCVVLCDGTVQPCCQVGHAAKSVMGSALDEGLMAVWKGPRYCAFRAEMAEGRPGVQACRTCVSTAIPGHAEDLVRLNREVRHDHTCDRTGEMDEG